MRLTLLLVLLLVSTANAQVSNLSFRIGMNYPLIGSHTGVYRVETISLSGIPTSSATGRVKEWFVPKVGLSGSFQFQYPISSRYYFQSGIDVSYLRYQYKTSVDLLVETELYFMGGTQVGSPIVGTIFNFDQNGRVILSTEKSPGTDLGSTRVLYTRLPLLFGTRILKNHIQISTGLVTSFLVSSSIEVGTIIIDNPFAVNSTKTETNGQNFHKVLFGVSLNANYIVFGRLGIVFGYDRSLTSFYKNQDWTHYNNLELGINWFLKKQ